ncbi:MAG: HDOD domain-containing protein [Verrucomicrobia bacterium]|nr:HDOD domain-containing protein [Verrucomicrobiota bacterium]
MEDYKSVLASAKDLPTLPNVVLRLHSLIRDPNSGAAEIAEVINRDVALTSKTLRLVNSAFYGFAQRVDSVAHAIVIMGMNKVKSLVLTASVLDTFKNRGFESFDYAGFWEHAIGTGITAEALAKHLKSNVTEDAFVAGLLHDLGKLIFCQYFPEDHAKVMHLINEQQLTVSQAENQLLGFDHTLIGSWLAEKWKFPEELCLSIRMHHEPAHARVHRDRIWLVHAADVFTRALGIGNGGDPFVPERHRQVWDHFQLNATLVDTVFQQALDGMANAGEFLELLKN